MINGSDNCNHEWSLIDKSLMKSKAQISRENNLDHPAMPPSDYRNEVLVLHFVCKQCGGIEKIHTTTAYGEGTDITDE